MKAIYAKTRSAPAVVDLSPPPITLTWRGSVSDLATDLACALTDSQVDLLVDYLSDGIFVAKKRERSGG